MADAQPTWGFPPENPKPNQTWTDEFGELYTFDGKDWVPAEDVLFLEPDPPFRST